MYILEYNTDIEGYGRKNFRKMFRIRVIRPWSTTNCATELLMTPLMRNPISAGFRKFQTSSIYPIGSS